MDFNPCATKLINYEMLVALTTQSNYFAITSFRLNFLQPFAMFRI